MKRISQQQYEKALKTIRLFEDQKSICKIKSTDLSYTTCAVSIERIKHGQITDRQLMKLQDNLSALEVPWFDIGTEDMGYLTIGSDEREMEQYESKILRALNAI